MAFAAVGTAAQSSPRDPRDEPRAFARAAKPSDALPSWLQRRWPHDYGRILASRRVATYQGRARQASLYVFKTSSGKMCHMLVWRGAGGGCNRGTLFRRDDRVAAGSGQLLAGIAADEVARVVIIGSKGVRHRVHLSPDNGFIFDCRAYNGCTCVVKWLDAYTADGRRVAHQDWLGYGCSRRR